MWGRKTTRKKRRDDGVLSDKWISWSSNPQLSHLRKKPHCCVWLKSLYRLTLAMTKAKFLLESTTLIQICNSPVAVHRRWQFISRISKATQLSRVYRSVCVGTTHRSYFPKWKWNWEKRNILAIKINPMWEAALTEKTKLSQMTLPHYQHWKPLEKRKPQLSSQLFSGNSSNSKF